MINKEKQEMTISCTYNTVNSVYNTNVVLYIMTYQTSTVLYM